jgi:hypothetical protein
MSVQAQSAPRHGLSWERRRDIVHALSTGDPGPTFLKVLWPQRDAAAISQPSGGCFDYGGFDVHASRRRAPVCLLASGRSGPLRHAGRGTLTRGARS